MSERAGSVPAAYWELTKPRLSFLSVLTALAGYFCSAPEQPTDAKVLISLAIGTALAAGGCGAINMWWESNADAKMDRTRNRPIPAGILKPGAVLLFGLLLLTLGVMLVWNGANALAGALTAATAVSYLLLYTPLKSVTSWCTLVGSLPGAIPPIIGTAAKLGQSGEPHIDRMGWLLFALLFFWQIPHFMSLAFLWREDYARGGFKIVTVGDLRRRQQCGSQVGQRDRRKPVFGDEGLEGDRNRRGGLLFVAKLDGATDQVGQAACRRRPHARIGQH